MKTPIVLVSNIANIGIGQTLEFETNQLQNPFRTPMLVEEIRFDVSGFEDSDSVSRGSPNQLIYADISLGRVPLTNGYIPIGNLGKELSSGNFNDNGFVTWKLPKPLYVPATEFLTTKIYRTTEMTQFISTAGTIPIRVAYAARSLGSDDPIPKSIIVPWATNFNIPLQTIVAGVTSFVSTEAHLVNPFNSAMRIQRFIGRSQFGNYVTPAVFGDADDTARAPSRVFVRAVDSYDNILVRDPTPFSNLFLFVDKTWTVNTILPSKGFYIMMVDYDFETTDANSIIGTNISMIGYREVSLQ